MSKKEVSDELLSASKEMFDLLRKYPSLAYHIQLMEREGNAVFSVSDGTADLICDSLIVTAYRKPVFQRILEAACDYLQKNPKKGPTEEEQVDEMIDTWEMLNKVKRDPD